MRACLSKACGHASTPIPTTTAVRYQHALSSVMQVTAPVMWETIMKDLLANGYEKGYELGPGTVLSGIMKRTDKKAPAVENIEV